MKNRILLFLLLLAAGSAWAQAPARLIYSQQSATSANDQVLTASLTGTFPTTGTTQASDAGQFTQPNDLSFDPVNNFLFVVDNASNTGILRYNYNRANGTLSNRTVVVAGTASATYQGVAVDAANGRLYFTQSSVTPGLDAIKVAEGVNAATISTPITPVELTNGGAGNFSNLNDIVYDAAGRQLYVADAVSAGGGILRYAVNANGTSLASSTPTTLIGGTGTSGLTYTGLALDAANSRLYFAQSIAGSTSTADDAVKYVSTSGGTATTLIAAASNGVTLYAPSDLTIDLTGQYLYVADQGNQGTNSIVRFKLDGTAATAQSTLTTIIAASSTGAYSGVALDGGFTSEASVTSITTTTTNPTNASSITYTVTFSAGVTGLTSGNFSLSPTVSGAGIGTPTVVSGSNNTQYTVTVSTGPGTSNGTLQLNLSTDAGLTPSLSNEPYAGPPIVIDKTAPTTTISSSTPGVSNGSTTNTTPIAFRITFSEGVLNFVSGDVQVTGGTLSGFSATSSSTYTFNVTPSGSGSTVRVNVAANVANDQAGNGNTAATEYTVLYQQPLVANSQPVTVNLAANGTATLNASSVNNGSSGGGTLTYTIQKIVYGRVPENGTLALSTPNGVNFTSIPFAVYGSPTGTNGNYGPSTCGSPTGNGSTPGTDVRATVGPLLLNRNSGTITADNTTFGDPCSGTPKALAVQAAYSANAPSLTYDCSEAGKTQYVLLTVSSSDGQTNTSVAQVMVNASPTATISSVSPSAAPRGATVTVTGTNLSGVNSVTVGGATATVSGNNGSSFTFVVPTTATTGAGNLSITAPCAQTLSPAFTVQQPQTATPSLTSPANGSTTSGFPVFAGTAAPNATVTLYLNNQNVGTLTADASGNFAATFGSALPSGTYTTYVTAQVSGQSVSNASSTIAFTVDSTRPTPTVSSTSASPTSTAPIPFRVTFDEPVSGFTASSITVSNGTVASFTGASPGTVFNLTVTPAGSGNVTVSVGQNVTQDGVGNQNVASNLVTINYQQPTTATPVLTAPANNSYTNNNRPEYRGTTVPNAFISIYRNLVLTDTTIANALGNFHKISNAALTDGQYSVYVTATSSGSATSANSNTNTFTVDTSRPSVTITSAAGTSGGSTGTTPIPFSVSFTENVNGSFVQGDLSVSGGTIVVGSFSGSGAGPYTFTVTPDGIGSTVSVNVAQNVAQDAAGNFNTAAPAAYTLRYAPELTATVSTSSASPTSTSPIPFSVSFSQSVGTTFTASDVTVTGGTLNTASFNGSGSGPYTFTVTPSGIGTVSVSLAANVASDANNTGNSASNTVSVQFVTPTITVTPASLTNGVQGTAYNVTFTASGGSGTYSYIYSGQPVPGLSFVGSTLAGTPTASGTYSFRITATDNSAAPGPYSGFRDYTLTISAPASAVWTGNTDTNWFTASNWSTGVVPTSTTDATIPGSPSGGRFPVLSAGAANARNLTLNSGSTLTMSGGTLAIAANLTNNGTFTATGGTVGMGATIASNILGAGNTRFWNLTVGSNGVQQSTSASTSVQRLLTLNGTYTTNGNPFTLESNANLTAMVINNGSNLVNGTVTVQRYIVPDQNPNLGYRHVSAPISNATVGSLAISGGYSPVVNPDYNTSATPGSVRPFPTLYGYDQSRLATATNDLGTFDKGWFSPGALTDAMTVGKGYTALAAANQTWSFVGTLNNGNLTQTLARNAGATAADAGLHLVGNPYPSPLDLSQVAAADRVNLDQFVAVWASNNPANPYAGAYAYYNNGLGTAGPVVALGQGFFTRVTPGQTSGTLTFRNSQRLTSYQNPTYHRTAETRPVVQLGLQATGSTDSDAAFVYFEQGATAAFDSPFDAPKIANPSGLNLSSGFAGSENLAINGLSPLTGSQVVVPLQVGVPAVGSYTLSATQLLNLGSTPTYLRDRQTGAVVDLVSQPSYRFTVSNASALITGRFELVFSPQAPLATAPAALAAQVALYPNPATGSAFVELPASLGRQAVTGTLVDAIGRQVRTLTLPAQGAVAHTLDLRELPSGVYMLRLATSAGTIVKKLTVE